MNKDDQMGQFENYFDTKLTLVREDAKWNNWDIFKNNNSNLQRNNQFQPICLSLSS